MATIDTTPRRTGADGCGGAACCRPVIKITTGVGPAGKNGVGVPPGGKTGQYLMKNGAEDYGTEWVELGLHVVDGCLCQTYEEVDG